MIVLPKISVNSGDVVNTKDIIAGGVPTGTITIKGPYGIVQRLARSRQGWGALSGARCRRAFFAYD